MAKIVGFDASLTFDNFKRPLFRTKTTLQNGNVIQKTLMLEDFLKLFNVSLKEKKQKYCSIPVLPKNFFQGGISEKSNTFWVALFVPAGKHQYVCAQTGEQFFLAYPGLLFVLQSANGIIREKKCFAIKDDICTEHSVLMHYPYGHVSMDGDICMGTCSSAVKNFTTADEFVESFFLGTDAGHYYTPGVMAKPKISLRELIGKVDQKGYYPTEWLVPVIDKSGKNITVKSFLEKFKKATTTKKC